MRPRFPTSGNVYVLCIETFKFRLLEQFEPIIIQLRVIAQSRARACTPITHAANLIRKQYSYLFVQISRSLIIRVKKMEIENNWHCTWTQLRVAQFFWFSKKHFILCVLYRCEIFLHPILFSFDLSSPKRIFFSFFLLYLDSRYMLY